MLIYFLFQLKSWPNHIIIRNNKNNYEFICYFVDFVFYLVFTVIYYNVTIIGTTFKLA